MFLNRLPCSVLVSGFLTCVCCLRRVCLQLAYVLILPLMCFCHRTVRGPKRRLFGTCFPLMAKVAAVITVIPNAGLLRFLRSPKSQIMSQRGLLAVYKQVALSATAEEAVAHLTRGINTYHDEEVTVAELYGRRASFHFENRDWSAAVADYREAYIPLQIPDYCLNLLCLPCGRMPPRRWVAFRGGGFVTIGRCAEPPPNVHSVTLLLCIVCFC